MTDILSHHEPRASTAALLADATRLGGVELKVSDLDRSLHFYTRILGLSLHARGERSAALGAGGEDLVTLRADPHARRAAGHAGLYHFALLFPTREELARVGWRVATTGTAIDGASDHGTHEAIYLGDPDGIGIELAADRPREEWPELSGEGLLHQGPQPLDLRALLATVDAPTGDGAPRGLADRALTIGHIHLHVGDLDAAERFYREGLGFGLVMSLPTARFVAAGGYHHHVAYNLWRGAGVGPAPEDAVGLLHWTLLSAGASELQAIRDRLSALGVAVAERDEGPAPGAGGGLLARDPSAIAVLIR